MIGGTTSTDATGAFFTALAVAAALFAVTGLFAAGFLAAGFLAAGFFAPAVFAVPDVVAEGFTDAVLASVARAVADFLAGVFLTAGFFAAGFFAADFFAAGGAASVLSEAPSGAPAGSGSESLTRPTLSTPTDDPRRPPPGQSAAASVS